MKRYKTFAVLLVLILFWSLFFGAFKLYCWSILDSTLHPSLENIAGYLSAGGILAYVIGGALAESFYKRSLLIVCALFSLLLLTLGILFGTTSMLLFAPVVMGIGFFYSLWAVIKNILISIEIHRTGLPDSVVTGVVNIIFIVFLIIGVVLGPVFAEKLGMLGAIPLALILIGTFAFALPLDYEPAWHLREIPVEWLRTFFRRKHASVRDTLHRTLPEIRKNLRRYGMIILAMSLLWAITTIVSQKSVEIAKEVFLKTESEASYLLLYSSIGAILGNVVSMALQKRRWISFAIVNLLFAGLILVFPSVIHYALRTDGYSDIIVLATAMGVFFGAAANLLEGYYFKKLYDDDNKEYGAVAYGLALSIVLTVMMLGSSIVTPYVGHEGVMYTVGVLVVVLGGLIEWGMPTSEKTEDLTKK